MARTTEPLRRFAHDSLARLRLRGRAAFTWTLRLTAAAVASYVVARAIFPGSDALLAPLTALLVVQLTPVSLLSSGIERVISVVAGVAVAVAFSSVVHISWWSLAIVIALSLLIAQALRLGGNALEVPISAMLVLGAGVGGAESAAWQRMAETLVGAGVGVLSNLLFPPRIATADADKAIGGLAEDLARLLEGAADDMEGGLAGDAPLLDRMSRWLGEARRLTHAIPDVGGALIRAEESRRLNLRALGTADVGPGLRHGLEALEHSAIAVRSMFRSLEDAGRARESQPQKFNEDLELLAVELLLRELAAAVRAFGLLLHAEAQPSHELPAADQLREGSEALNEARARLSELLMIDRRDDAVFAELNFALLATVERLSRELNLDGRVRNLEQRPKSSTRHLVIPTRRDHPDATETPHPRLRIRRRRT